MKVTITDTPVPGLRALELIQGRLYTITSPQVQAGGVILCVEALREGADHDYYTVLMVRASDAARTRYGDHDGTLVKNDGFRYRELTDVELTARLA